MSHIIEFNNKRFTSKRDETLLDTLHRHGVNLRSQCRVGSCKSCQCKIVQGEVKEIIDTDYSLSSVEKSSGIRLACQSIPSSDVVIDIQSKNIVAVDKISKLLLPQNFQEQYTHQANFFDYAKYSLFHIIALASAFVLLIGGQGKTIGLWSIIAMFILGDIFVAHDEKKPQFKYKNILTLQLWLALPLLVFIVFCALWSVSESDVFGFGVFLNSIFPYDFLNARSQTHWIHHVSGIITTGLMIGMVGTITAHELIHRPWDRVSMVIGRWLLAFSFDASFSIEHVYGHHRYVSTPIDPATAPRGRNVYWHVIVSTIKGNISAWKIEAKRLKNINKATLNYKNRVIRGYFMSLAILCMIGFIFGINEVLYFTVCAIWGKSLLEIVNYIEHYGLIRKVSEIVQPHFSWNSNHSVSSWALFNLNRHSHHHAQGEVPFYELKPLPEAPKMVGGYLTCIIVSLIPPLWFKLIDPQLVVWDKQYNTK